MIEESLRTEVRRLAAERAKLTLRLEEVTARLAEAAVALADGDVPETKVADLAGVSRQTIRTWRGKEDYRGHKI